MTIDEAQQDLRHTHLGGAPGVITSGSIWLIAAAVTAFVGVKAGIATLFFGGMLIYPLGVVLTRALGRSARPRTGNPLVALAMQSTMMMMFGIVIALGVAMIRPDWFFPAMLLVIGGRYLVFATIYGLSVQYWSLGCALAGAGMLLAIGNAPPATSAMVGGLVEIGAYLPMLIAGRNALPIDATASPAPTSPTPAAS